MQDYLFCEKLVGQTQSEVGANVLLTSAKFSQDLLPLRLILLPTSDPLQPTNTEDHGAPNEGRQQSKPPHVLVIKVFAG
jgi:hypothetical protein